MSITSPTFTILPSGALDRPFHSPIFFKAYRITLTMQNYLQSVTRTLTQAYLHVLLLLRASICHVHIRKHCDDYTVKHQFTEDFSSFCSQFTKTGVHVGCKFKTCHPTFTDKKVCQPSVTIRLMKTWQQKYVKFPTNFTDQVQYRPDKEVN